MPLFHWSARSLHYRQPNLPKHFTRPRNSDMASFNQIEGQPISPEDNEQAQGESAMKLIADFGVAGKLRKRNGFWRRLCCCCGSSGVSADEVINLSVPVKHLNKRVHMVVNCRSTKINVNMHPEDENDKEILRDVEMTQLKELLATLRAGERSSLSTRFSTPFLDFTANSVYGDAESIISTTTDRGRRGTIGRKRTKTL